MAKEGVMRCPVCNRPLNWECWMVMGLLTIAAATLWVMGRWACG